MSLGARGKDHGLQVFLFDLRGSGDDPHKRRLFRRYYKSERRLGTNLILKRLYRVRRV